MVNRINMFNGLNIHPVPLEFSQGLSTSEWLGHLQAKVNECIDSVNSIDGENKRYTDERFNELSNTLVVKCESLQNLILVTKNGLKDYTDEQVRVLVGLIEKFTVEITEDMTQLFADNVLIHERVNDLYHLLKQGTVMVVSPMTGETVTVQSAINELFELVQGSNGSMPITAEDYEDLLMSCDDYDGFGVTAKAYDFDGLDCFGVGREVHECSGFSNVTTQQFSNRISPSITIERV